MRKAVIFGNEPDKKAGTKNRVRMAKRALNTIDE